jgi:hypothetical protein
MLDIHLIRRHHTLTFDEVTKGITWVYPTFSMYGKTYQMTKGISFIGNRTNEYSFGRLKYPGYMWQDKQELRSLVNGIADDNMYCMIQYHGKWQEKMEYQEVDRVKMLTVAGGRVTIRLWNKKTNEGCLNNDLVLNEGDAIVITQTTDNWMMGMWYGEQTVVLTYLV